ncbi:hypothetical protein GCM10022224_075190 [Nonomuraea antimicrobica]|uniref:Acyl carrier protein n=1 Tax=Nonomuraea antimicrobica TaxID=561173 RepID=A0ABP7D1Z3_9ACTN
MAMEPDRTDWQRLLAQVRADALDCLQSNLAVVADRRHGPGTHLALGAGWGFQPGADGGFERSPAERLAEAETALGLRVAETWRTSDGTFLRRMAREHDPLFVVSDAHRMPWLPYAGREHMTHSFLLCAGPDDDRVTIVDAYHNDTRWGPARPGTWTLPADEVGALLGDCATAYLLESAHVTDVHPGRVLAENAARLSAAEGDGERYLKRARQCVKDPGTLDRLVLDIWMLLRERMLHEAWLRHAGLPAEAVGPMGDLVDRWRALATQSYVAQRRRQRSGVQDLSLADRMAALLRDEAEVARQLVHVHAHAGAGDEAVVAIRRALMETLSIDAEALDRAPTLRELPGFDSYRLVEVLDSVEQLLGRPYDAAGLSARTVRDAVSLAELFSPAERHSGIRVLP